MRKFLRAFLMIILTTGFCSNKNVKTAVGCCATNIINSPKLKGESETMCMNDGSTSVALSITGNMTFVDIGFDGDKANLSFSNIPQLRRIENFKSKHFAVLIDSIKGPIDCKLIAKEGNRGKCSFNIPKESSYLDVHVYGQDDNDPDFLIREENFLCKFKFLNSYGTFAYLKKQENCVSFYDEFGDLVENQKPTIYQSIIPNFFVVGPLKKVPLSYNLFAVLDLPDGKNENVQYEDRVFTSSFIRPDFGNTQEIDNALSENGKYIFFKVPEDVNDVCLKLYMGSTQTCDTGDNGYVGQFKIKINRE